MSLSSESPSAAVSGGGSGEIMLFGVRVKVDPMRKSVSMNNLSEYDPVPNNTGNPSGKELPKAAADGGGAVDYASADDAMPPPSNGNGDRKRGVPWTEEEHKLFLIGLQKVGKGDWRGISRNYVKTRTPTQVASHAQKYFLRRSNLNRRRRRSSLFDITTDSVSGMPIEEGKRSHQDCSPAQPTFMPLPLSSNINGFSIMPYPMAVNSVLLSMQSGKNPMDNSGFAQSDRLNNNNSSAMLVHQVPVVTMPNSSTMVDLNLNQQATLEQWPLSLRLSLSSPRGGSSYQVISSFNNGDSIVSVA